MSTLFRARQIGQGKEEELGGQMSFLDHLDELRRRLIRSVIFVFVATAACWFVSGRIYSFLAVPGERALAEVQRRQVAIDGLTGSETIAGLGSLKENDQLRYVFPEETNLGTSIVPLGTTVTARVAKDPQGQLGLFTDEALLAGDRVIPKGVKLPVNFAAVTEGFSGVNDKFIVTTALEAFSLYVKVSLYAALCLSVPFLLFQIWAFVSPGLYPHERGYVTPFILLSSVSFVLGALFAYYIIFPAAVKYLLGLGEGFRLLLKAADYFDFIILVMLGMGVVFQMPAISYVLSRIGLVTAGFLLRVWRTAFLVILIAAALLSPTGDIPNMLLFAAPMIVLYFVSIFVAWIFGKPRTAT